MKDLAAFRNGLTCLSLTFCVSLVTACSDNISQADVDFVSAGMPAQFQSLRMYGAPLDPDPGSSRLTMKQGRLHQACAAMLQTAHNPEREVVILENDSGKTFDLDATHTPEGWRVTSDGLNSPSADTVGFRTQFTNCISAIQEKYRAEPEKAPFSRDPLDG
jgi:hypothetical protein